MIVQSEFIHPKHCIQHLCIFLGHYQVGVSVTDDERDDVQLQEAIQEMRRLDQILSDMICKEKEVRRQRRAVQAKLWQELLVDTLLTLPVHKPMLVFQFKGSHFYHFCCCVILWTSLQQNKPEGHSESAHEAMNTRLFLALEAPTGERRSVLNGLVHSVTVQNLTSVL